MQHATPEAYEEEARAHREIARQLEERGMTHKARQRYEMAEDCMERAAKARNHK